MYNKVLLMILDGWGIATDKSVSAIDAAHTPFIDALYKKYANSQLVASGLAVGLPEGQMGNSEVGHMNLGAGRVVYQDLVKINRAVENETIAKNPVLLEAFAHAKNKNKNIHFIGLLSNGGVHAHIDHLKGLIKAAHNFGLENVFLHAFTDGRDCSPTSGKSFITSIVEYMRRTVGSLATVVGRYYAMDRDNRWERVKIAYDAMVKGVGKKTNAISQSIARSYEEGITDEFIKPIIAVDEQGIPIGNIAPEDVVICFNFRTDRGRQITMALTQKDFPKNHMYAMPLYYLTLTNYDDTFKNIRVVFEKDKLAHTLGEVLAKAGKKQVRVAETEKYPHVTFFFSGGREKNFVGESRLLCPSPKVATYDLAPAMCASNIRDAIIPVLQERATDFICLNFANPDMVGHTGVFQAVITACETVNDCAEAVITTALAHGYTTLVIADHGNADKMLNPDGSVHTAHTTSLVPCILVDDAYKGALKNGKLGDIAPTILAILGIEKPKEMTGESLI